MADKYLRCITVRHYLYLDSKSMQNNSLFYRFWATILPTFGGLGKNNNIDYTQIYVISLAPPAWALHTHVALPGVEATTLGRTLSWLPAL